MQTVSIEEAAEKLDELIEGLGAEPIVLTSGQREVAYLTSPEAVRRERFARWNAFFAASKEAADELKSSLDKEGISVEEFLEDLLRDDA